MSLNVVVTFKCSLNSESGLQALEVIVENNAARKKFQVVSKDAQNLRRKYRDGLPDVLM